MRTLQAILKKRRKLCLSREIAAFMRSQTRHCENRTKPLCNDVLLFPASILKWLLIILLLLGVLFCNPPFVLADDFIEETSSFDSDDDEIFEEDEPEENKKDKEQSFLDDFRFTLSYSFAYGTVEPEETINDRLSLRCEFEKSVSKALFIKFDGKANLFFAGDHIAKAEDEEINSDGDIREFYFSLNSGNLTLKAGKQILVWGETDGEVINDVISPRDNSEFVFIDLIDARKGQYISSLNFYSGIGDFYGFSVFKPKSDEQPDEGTRYYIDSGITIVDDKTDFSDVETGFRWKKIFGKFEFSLMYANLFQNSIVLDHISGSSYRKVYERYNFYGFSASWTKGSFLIKLDNSFKNDFPIQLKDTSDRFVMGKRDVIDSALALEYSSGGTFTANLELTSRHTNQYSDDIYGMEKDNYGLYFLINKKFLNETLDVKYNLYFRLNDESLIHKFYTQYSFTDEIKFSIEYAIFDIDEDDEQILSYKDEDRLGIEISFYW